MDNIVVYRTIIILNILNKLTDCIALRVVKNWLTKLEVYRLILLKYYFYFC